MNTENLNEERQSRTVRELGGEVWAEIVNRFGDDIEWRLQGRLVDLVMGVLARHLGRVIENDQDLPVSPLARAEDLPSE
jgi:hypothetical protein